ncbi:hypothetical protein IWQ61_004970 [Dispira simplex]|nr:hypothetical protein IWQ61_004970 [Dispira simplex]
MFHPAMLAYCHWKPSRGYFLWSWLSRMLSTLPGLSSLGSRRQTNSEGDTTLHQDFTQVSSAPHLKAMDTGPAVTDYFDGALYPAKVKVSNISLESAPLSEYYYATSKIIKKMPELPEVERARRLAHTHCVGRWIQHVDVVEDTIVMPDLPPRTFRDKLVGHQVVDTGRRGKLFWLTLDNDDALLLHFGMTGNLAVKDAPRLVYRRPLNDDGSWPPKFYKFVLTLGATVTPSSHEDASQLTDTFLAFSDARRFARVRICSSPLTCPFVTELGFDPLLDMPSVEKFSKLVLKRRLPIKALLLDQKFLAGVGNWIADEILYQSAVHPQQYTHTLTPSELKALHHNTVYVCETASKVNADHTQFPSDWLFHVRWGKGKRGMIHTTSKGHPIMFETVGGRTSAIVPAVQQLRPVSDVSIAMSTKSNANSKVDVKSEPTKTQIPASKVHPTTRRSTRTRKSPRTSPYF